MYGRFYGQKPIPYPEDPEDFKDPETLRKEKRQKQKIDTIITSATTTIYGILILMFLENGFMLFAMHRCGPEYMFFFYVLSPVFTVIGIIYFLIWGRRKFYLELSTENIIVVIAYELFLFVCRQIMIVVKYYAIAIIVPYMILAVAGVVYVYIRSDIDFRVKRWLGWLIGYFVIVDFMTVYMNALG